MKAMFSTTWSRAIEGWVAGCAAATGVVYVYAVVSFLYAANVSDSHPFSVRALAFTTLVSMILPTLLIFLVTCLLTAIPAAVTVWLSERFRIRSIFFFGLAGAVIGGASAYLSSGATLTQPPQLSPLFVSAGLAAGLAYWSVAGRHAGREQSSTPA